MIHCIIIKIAVHTCDIDYWFASFVCHRFWASTFGPSIWVPPYGPYFELKSQVDIVAKRDPARLYKMTAGWENRKKDAKYTTSYLEVNGDISAAHSEILYKEKARREGRKVVAASAHT